MTPLDRAMREADEWRVRAVRLETELDAARIALGRADDTIAFLERVIRRLDADVYSAISNTRAAAADCGTAVAPQSDTRGEDHDV